MTSPYSGGIQTHMTVTIARLPAMNGFPAGEK